MTPIIDLLTDHGGMLAAGSTVLLGIGTIAMAMFGPPVQRQRLGELTLAATMVWLLLACVPLPRWDIGVGGLPASAERDVQPIEARRAGTQAAWGAPLSDAAADSPVDAIAVGAGFEGPASAVDGATDIRPPTSGDYMGASVVPALEPSPTAKGPTVGWRGILAASYAAGVVGCVVWLLAGHVLLARTERIATAPDKWLADLYDSVTSGRRVKRARLLVSGGCRRPAVYGIWRPVIILPRELCRAENSERLRHVLRHESAHVWRGDARGNLIVNAAFPCLFFHPLYWWIRHRIQFSRELIADDWAAGLSSKESYADELVQLVSQGRGVRLGTIGALGVFRFNTPFYRRMKMLIDRRQPLATTLPLTWKLLGIAFGAVVVAGMVCVAGVPRATAEGGFQVVVDTAEAKIVDEPLSGEAMDDSSPAEKQRRQPIHEAIRAALKDIPGATVQTVVDPKTGRVSVTVGVPREYFDLVWARQQQKARGPSRRMRKGMGSEMMGGAEFGSGMMMEEMMGAGHDEEVSGGSAMMGPGMDMDMGMGGMGSMGTGDMKSGDEAKDMGGMGMGAMGAGGMEDMMGGGGMDNMGAGGMGMGGMETGMGEDMGTGMGLRGGMGADNGAMGMYGGGMMGMEGRYGMQQIPRDQLNRVQIEETDNIRDTVAALLRKTDPGADPGVSVEVSVVRDIRLESCLVALIDEAKIPARAEGPVVELTVRVGDRVERGQILARIDDRRAKLKLDEAKGLLEETLGNDLDVRYAEVAAEIATADYESALDANRNAPGSLPKAELRRLAKESALAKIRVEQAERAKAGTRAQESQLVLAESELSDYRTEAPLDGIVVEVYPRVGEWVRSGDPIFHIVEMSRLRVESRLEVYRYSPDEVRGSEVIIEFTPPHGRVQRMPGKVTFVSPLVQGDNRYKVVAEVSNQARDGGYLLRPGMQVTMVVKLASRPGIR